MAQILDLGDLIKRSLIGQNVHTQYEVSASILGYMKRCLIERIGQSWI